MTIQKKTSETDLGPVRLKRKIGSEQFKYNNEPQKATLLNFWQWSSSDLISNSLRGILAEFIVAMAVGKHDGVSGGWNAYDLITNNGIKVEVKSAAYIQSWYQKTFSKIVFSIRETRAWSAETNILDKQSMRQADIYVFALFKYQGKKEIADPMNLNQWVFYVISTKRFEKNHKKAKSITLAKLEKLQPIKCSYKRLNRYILLEAYKKDSLPD